MPALNSGLHRKKKVIIFARNIQCFNHPNN